MFKGCIRLHGKNLKSQVDTVKNIVKGDMGDKFHRQAGLRLDEPNPRDVLSFYHKILSFTSTDVAK